MDAVPSGSHLALYDGVQGGMTDEAVAEAIDKAAAEYAQTGAVPYNYRRADEILQLFHGLRLLTPGLSRSRCGARTPSRSALSNPPPTTARSRSNRKTNGPLAREVRGVAEAPHVPQDGSVQNHAP